MATPMYVLRQFIVDKIRLIVITHLYIAAALATAATHMVAEGAPYTKLSYKGVFIQA